MSAESNASLLDDIDAAEWRSISFDRAEKAGRFLILWGAVWMLGDLLTWRMPGRAGPIWTGLVLAGLLGQVFIIRGMCVLRDAGVARRLGIACAAFYAFLGASFAILHPSGLQVAAFIPLTVALAYVLLGLFWSQRIIVAGSLIFAVTLVGWFGFGQFFLPWMALAGGGSLMVSGMVLRVA